MAQSSATAWPCGATSAICSMRRTWLVLGLGSGVGLGLGLGLGLRLGSGLEPHLATLEPAAAALAGAWLGVGGQGQ